MKYVINKLQEESKVEISVVFTKKEYDAKYEVELEKAMAEAEAPGFRKGKLPKSMFLKKFGDARVHQNVANELINESYMEIAEKEKLEVVGYPKIDLLTDIKDDEWGYKAVVAVYPEIEAKDYFGIVAKKEEVNIDEAKVEAEVNRNLKNHADLEVKEGGTLEKGNTAVFDFTGYVDGKEFEGGKAENYELEIGSGQFIPGFEDQMVGMKAEEERTLKVKFPDEYAKELAGKDAEFKVKLHEIKQRVLPELNDEFVKELDIKDVDTVAKWKEFLKGNLITDATEAANNKFEDDVFRALLEKNPVVIPDDMIASEVEHRMKHLEETAKQYNMPAELLLKYQGIESVDQYKELIKPGIKNDIHYQIVIAAIVKQEKVKLLASDYTKYYKQMAKGGDVEEVKAKYPKERVTEYFKMLKAHDLILENVKGE
jgi:trigger factor